MLCGSGRRAVRNTRWPDDSVAKAVAANGCKKKTSRREDGKPHGDAEGSVRDRLAARQALHADEAPGAVVDQPLQRLAQRVEEHFIDPLDQLAFAMQL